ncbi:hypothetical protein [Nocardia aurantiaca]|uniref:Uncharacterized protein n=1 Tax=Nocardia aurantiaca TaxID=2675850 RepID=A0A6I3KWR9_9NOCA|nr:hypothetical protein [Nocardia aurantiaca]MTE13891.1 hypothetical protein [Nocardia aurantiaca]
MDASLAAVLGAVVGAIGPSTTAAVSGVLGRRSSLVQMKVDYTKMVYDHRREAYQQFATRVQSVHAFLGNAQENLVFAGDLEAPVRDNQMEGVGKCFAEAETSTESAILQSKTIRELYADVSIQSPDQSLTLAANALVIALDAELEHTRRWLVSELEIDDWAGQSEYRKRALEAHRLVSERFLDFSRAASNILGSDGTEIASDRRRLRFWRR